jgi:hypothetical protein
MGERGLTWLRRNPAQYFERNRSEPNFLAYFAPWRENVGYADLRRVSRKGAKTAKKT